MKYAPFDTLPWSVPRSWSSRTVKWRRHHCRHTIKKGSRPARTRTHLTYVKLSWQPHGLCLVESGGNMRSVENNRVYCGSPRMTRRCLRFRNQLDIQPLFFLGLTHSVCKETRTPELLSKAWKQNAIYEYCLCIKITHPFLNFAFAFVGITD